MQAAGTDRTLPGWRVRLRDDRIASVARIFPAALLVLLALAVADRTVVAADDAQPPTATMRLAPRVVPSVHPGSVVTFEIWLDDPTELGAFQLTLEYTSGTLEFESIALGPLLGSTGREVIELPPQTGPGRVTYGAVSAPGRPGASLGGLLAVARFRASAPGRAEVRLADAEVVDTGQDVLPLELGPPSRVGVHAGIFVPFAYRR
jgi:hypothetical protein